MSSRRTESRRIAHARVRRAVTNVEGLEPRRLLAAELFFAATNGTNGNELWSYTGSGSPVRRSDISAGTASSSVSELTPYNGRIYFAATNGTTGTELYTFNGSSSVLVKDINIGAGSSFAEELTVYNGKLYFAADDGVNGSELWRYDSATNVATMVANINTAAGPAGTASAGSTPLGLTVWNNKLYFAATTGTSGRELWVYDSTVGANGTATQVADIRSGTSGSSPGSFAVFQNQLYFRANNGTSGSELWRYNGTNAPALAVDINPGATGSSPNGLTVFNNKIYFSANGSVNAGTEFWSFDGNTATQVADLYPGINNLNVGADSLPSNLVLFKGKLYFTANRGNGQELWTYTGTGSPTIVQESFTFPGFGTDIIDPAVFNDQLYFGVSSAVNDPELYRYSGTGTIEKVADIYPGSTSAPGYPGGVIPNGSFPSSLVVVDSSNFAPTISDIANQTIQPNTSRNLNFTVSDTETAAGSLALTVTSSNTTLFPTGSMVLGGVDGNRTLTLTPLASATTGTATITVTVTDFGGLTSTDTFTVTIASPNAAPVLNTSGNPAFDTINEDPATNTGLSVPDLIARLGGTKITDSDAGALQGIAITGSTETNGVWQYSLNSGGAWSPVGGVADGLARLLNADAAVRVRFVPNANYFGVLNPAITFRAWDRTSGTNGGTADTRINGGETAFSTASETASLTILSVNDTPVAVNDAYTTDKTLSRTVAVKANDTDVENDPLTIDRINSTTVSAGSVVTLASGAKVTVNPDGTLTYDPNNAFATLGTGATTTDSFTYRISDPSAASDTATVAFTITNNQIVVNTTADTIDTNAAVTSLREAVIAANASPQDQTIVLAAGNYLLNRTGALESAASTGDLDVTDVTGRLVIVGSSTAGTEILSSGLADRLFHVHVNASLELRNLTLRGGRATDDGINTAAAVGGAVLSWGTLVLSGVLAIDNRADGVAGANGAPGYRGEGPYGSGQIQPATAGLPGAIARGGAIYASGGSLVIQNSTITQSTAAGGRGGNGGLPFEQDNGNVPNDDRARGKSGGAGGAADGGAIYALNAAVSVSGTTLNYNTAVAGRGGDGSRGAELRGGYNSGGGGGAGGSARGGGLLFDSGVNGAVTGSGISNNTATGGAGGTGGDRGPQPGGPYVTSGEGGGGGGNGGLSFGGGVEVIANTGAVDLIGSLLSYNNATGGNGGVGGSGLGYANGLPGGNASGNGGGVALVSGTLRTVNSTLSGNTAAGTNNRGGGLFLAGGSLGLTNTTITLNSSGTGGGVSLAGAVPFNVANAIVAGNTGAVKDVQGTITSVKNSIVGDATGATGITSGTNGNLVGDPKLGPLANNGGALLTHALLFGSPAHDAGDNASATAAGLTTDVRGTGFPRFLDSADAGVVDTVDIGSFEASPTIADIANDSTLEDIVRLLNFNYGDGDLVNTFSATSSNTALVPNANLGVNGVNSVGNLFITPVANQSGTTTITVTITGANGQSMSDSFLFTVTPVNDAPEFTAGGNPTSFEDAGVQTVSPWASGIRPGPVTATDEASQTLSFQTEITGTTDGLAFTTAPAVSPSGALTYTPAPNSFGTATVRVRLVDSGPNTPVPNTNTSGYQTFTITVTPVNDAPTFTKGANQAVFAGSGAKTVANWASGFNGNDPGQSLVGYQVTGNSAPAAFAVAPAIAADGTLTYTPAATVTTPTLATITVTCRDNGGTANGGVDTSAPQTFTILVAPPITALYTINDGTTQRSMVKSVTVTFNQPVDIAAGAMTINVLKGNGAGTTAVITPAPDKRSAVITFTGTPVVGGSLADGIYDLSLGAAGVSVAGTAGLTMAAPANLNVVRHFGDLDGDRGISIVDFNAFTSAFGKTSTQAGFVAAFDYDGDNNISIADFNEFSTRFGKTMI